MGYLRKLKAALVNIQSHHMTRELFFVDFLLYFLLVFRSWTWQSQDALYSFHKQHAKICPPCILLAYVNACCKYLLWSARVIYLEAYINYVSTFILGLNPLCKFIIDTTMTFKICFRISTRDKCWWIIKICYCIYHASQSENIFKLCTTGICVGMGWIGRPEAFAGVAEFKSVFGSARMVNTITYFNYSSTFVLCPDSLCKLIICTTITSKLCFLIWIGCKCFCKY